MSIVTKNKTKAAQKLICLKKTRLITEDDLFLPEWEAINKEYDAHQNGEWVDKAIVSLLNSALFQRRVVFVLAKRPFRELARSDKNWKRPIGLKDENWKSLIQEITGREIVKCIHKTEKGRLVYEIIESDILNIINIDVTAQRNEAIKFANEMNDLDEGTTQGTTEGNRESEKEIERELEDQKTPTNLLKEEEIEIDLSFDSLPTKNDFSPPANIRIAADPSPKTQNHTPIQSKVVAPPTYTFNQIVNSWIASVNNKALDHLNYKNMSDSISSIVNTCKSNGLGRDEISGTKFSKLVFGGMKKSQKVQEWQEQVSQCIEQQADSIYTNISFEAPTLEQPVASGKPGQLRRKDFDTDRGYELYHESLTQGREIYNLGGSVAQYYESRAYAEQFPTIKKD